MAFPTRDDLLAALLAPAVGGLWACSPGAVDVNAALAEPGGGGSGGPGALFDCSPVGGGASTASGRCATCTNQTLTDPHKSVDANLDSFATLSLYQPGNTTSLAGTIGLRGTAQDGVVFPIGSRAGVIIATPDASDVQYSAFVSTYLQGSLQETEHVVVNHLGPSSMELRYLGFTATTEEFDAVSVLIEEIATGQDVHEYRIYEFCSDGGPKPAE